MAASRRLEGAFSLQPRGVRGSDRGKEPGRRDGRSDPAAGRARGAARAHRLRRGLLQRPHRPGPRPGGAGGAGLPVLRMPRRADARQRPRPAGCGPEGRLRPLAEEAHGGGAAPLSGGGDARDLQHGLRQPRRRRRGGGGGRPRVGPPGPEGGGCGGGRRRRPNDPGPGADGRRGAARRGPPADDRRQRLSGSRADPRGAGGGPSAGPPTTGRGWGRGRWWGTCWSARPR